MYYPRLLIADVLGDANANQTVAFSSVDERGQPAAHLTTSSALLGFTRSCQMCVVDLIASLVDVAQRTGIWPCWQVSS